MSFQSIVNNSNTFIEQEKLFLFIALIKKMFKKKYSNNIIFFINPQTNVWSDLNEIKNTAFNYNFKHNRAA